jgi:predicted metalloprotease
MIVFCVLYSKHKGRTQDLQDKETSMDATQTENKRVKQKKKKLAGCMNICLLWVFFCGQIISCVGPITRLEKCYQLWCAIMRDKESQ